MEPPAIFEGTCLTIHLITAQAEEFFGGLDTRERRDFKVAATILDSSLRQGRPPGGRSERIQGSDAGLFELRITPPRRRGPKARALYICEGPRLLVVRGLRKARRAIPRREIELGDRDAKAYQSRPGEEHGG